MKNGKIKIRPLEGDQPGYRLFIHPGRTLAVLTNISWREWQLSTHDGKGFRITRFRAITKGIAFEAACILYTKEVDNV